ncbi:MAG: MazG family protein [Opitutales bacterium]|jgi:XTP/dITP diphosphohydrolase/tetrapyrrole methylase family protein/MazG family protein
MQDLINTVERLRAPDGCPWDREQTHRSLCRCLQEETAELLDTIDDADMAHMREELGDVLLQVIMHAQIASESGHFDIDDVAAEINEKLIRRHPHVFSDAKADTTEEVLVKWDQIKATERKYPMNSSNSSVSLKRPPRHLTTLLYADELLKQLAKIHYTPSRLDEDRIRGMAEEMDEDQAGLKLMELVAACRKAKIDPEAALRRFSHKIVDGFEENLR